MILSLILATAFAFGATQQPSPGPTPETTATPTIAITPIPIPTPFVATPSPSASPSSAASPHPLASPSPAASPSATPTGLNLPPLKYHITPTPQPSAAPGAPQILAIDISDQTVYSGKVMAIRVTTNDVVSKVTVTSNGRSGQITQVAPGRFESSGTIPKLPPLMGGLNVNLVFTATTADGRSTSVKVPLKVKR
jgi:hypothetical protein